MKTLNTVKEELKLNKEILRWARFPILFFFGRLKSEEHFYERQRINQKKRCLYFVLLEANTLLRTRLGT